MTMYHLFLFLFFLSFHPHKCQDQILGEDPKLHRLQVLRLYENELQDLPEGLLDSQWGLLELSLQRNRLRELPPMLLRSLPHLETLLLDNNLIRLLPPQGFFGLNKLKMMTLGSNHITELSCCLFDIMPHLWELDLGRNSLATLPDGIFANLTSLGKLILSHNQLAALPRGAFTGLSKLLDLQLDANHLSALDDEVFASLPDLKTLNLRKNQLQSVPRGLLDPLKKLSSVYLSGNPWRCDCNLCYLHSWILSNREKVTLSTQVSCKSPPHLSGQAVTSLRDDHLICPDTPPLSASFTPSLPFTSTSSQGMSTLLSPGVLPTAAPTTLSLMASRHRQWLPPPGQGHREQRGRPVALEAPHKMLETPHPASRGPSWTSGTARSCLQGLAGAPARISSPSLAGTYLQGARSPWGMTSQGFPPRTPASSARRVMGCVSAHTSITGL
uniref:LRRCT domain-containing protein n=1 Tax=Athene cunicularia TaxID=194338 RepID=A0A663N1T5_ATHCN